MPLALGIFCIVRDSSIPRVVFDTLAIVSMYVRVGMFHYLKVDQLFSVFGVDVVGLHSSES